MLEIHWQAGWIWEIAVNGLVFARESIYKDLASLLAPTVGQLVNMGCPSLGSDMSKPVIRAFSFLLKSYSSLENIKGAR